MHAVGINRVLAESGVAKKTLYNHFPSKEDFVAATVAYRDRQYFTLRDNGVMFTMEPTTAGEVTIAIFSDTCGNLIQPYQLQ